MAFLLGSALAGAAGVLLACDADMTPAMGLRPLLMGIIAVVIGGIGSVPGAALGAILLALAENLGAWWISSMWRDAIAFIKLVVFLLARPQGFLGTPLRRAAV